MKEESLFYVNKEERIKRIIVGLKEKHAKLKHKKSKATKAPAYVGNFTRSAKTSSKAVLTGLKDTLTSIVAALLPLWSKAGAMMRGFISTLHRKVRLLSQEITEAEYKGLLLPKKRVVIENGFELFLLGTSDKFDYWLRRPNYNAEDGWWRHVSIFSTQYGELPSKATIDHKTKLSELLKKYKVGNIYDLPFIKETTFSFREGERITKLLRKLDRFKTAISSTNKYVSASPNSNPYEKNKKKLWVFMPRAIERIFIALMPPPLLECDKKPVEIRWNENDGRYGIYSMAGERIRRYTNLANCILHVKLNPTYDLKRIYTKNSKLKFERTVFNSDNAYALSGDIPAIINHPDNPDYDYENGMKHGSDVVIVTRTDSANYAVMSSDYANSASIPASRLDILIDGIVGQRVKIKGTSIKGVVIRLAGDRAKIAKSDGKYSTVYVRDIEFENTPIEEVITTFTDKP